MTCIKQLICLIECLLPPNWNIKQQGESEREGRARRGERDMASSIAQIMQSMRLEYIILSCEPERGLREEERDWKGQSEECEWGKGKMSESDENRKVWGGRRERGGELVGCRRTCTWRETQQKFSMTAWQKPAAKMNQMYVNQKEACVAYLHIYSSQLSCFWHYVTASLNKEVQRCAKVLSQPSLLLLRH